MVIWDENDKGCSALQHCEVIAKREAGSLYILKTEIILCDIA